LPETSTPVRHALPGLPPLRPELAAHRPAVARRAHGFSPAARPPSQCLL